MSEHQSIELDVADGPVSMRKRFHGRKLLTVTQQHGLRCVRYTIYITQRGRYAAYTTDTPDWSRLAEAGEAVWEDPRTWSGTFYETKDKSLDVYPDVDALVLGLPDDVGAAIRRALSNPAAAELDI